MLAAFKQPHPYRIVTLPHAHGGQPSRHIEVVRDVPVAIHLRIAETVECLRTALDYVAYALSFRRHGDAFASEVSFQVFDHLSEFKFHRPRTEKRLGHGAMKVLDGICPYRGGNDALWRITRLNNRAKHRFLGLIGLAMQDSILPPAGGNQLGAVQLGATGLGSLGQPAPSVPAGRVFVRLKDGAPLATPAREVSVDAQFPFEMAFDEPAILQDQPVRPTLQDFVRETQRVIELFTPVF